MPGATGFACRSTIAVTLAAGQSVKGPAIIEERETTIVILPGWTATVDQIGCIFATQGMSTWTASNWRSSGPT